MPPECIWTALTFSKSGVKVLLSKMEADAWPVSPVKELVGPELSLWTDQTGPTKTLHCLYQGLIAIFSIIHSVGTSDLYVNAVISSCIKESMVASLPFFQPACYAHSVKQLGFLLCQLLFSLLTRFAIIFVAYNVFGWLVRYPRGPSDLVSISGRSP